ncbi:MAG TPA: chemotaxis protein CheW [Roseiflexaceae bacterium]|nr:chemotaxis protein CheW [Roseiflexaceae bacterium]
MPTDLMLIVRTARRRYAVRRDDVIEIKLVADATAMPRDERGQPYIGFELGMLLDPADRSELRRRRALVVPLRRRKIALLADEVDSFQEYTQTIALPELLGARLSQPWAIGALVLDEEVIVQIDLLAIARSALARSSNGN